MKKTYEQFMTEGVKAGIDAVAYGKSGNFTADYKTPELPKEKDVLTNVMKKTGVIKMLQSNPEVIAHTIYNDVVLVELQNGNEIELYLRIDNDKNLSGDLLGIKYKLYATRADGSTMNFDVSNKKKFIDYFKKQAE